MSHPSLPVFSSPAAAVAPRPSDEPSRLWLLIRRYPRTLLTAAVLCAIAAWVAGGAWARPMWAIEGTLLYNPMPLPERHRGVVQLPTLPTYAGWVKDPAHLEVICREFNLPQSPDEFAAKCLKVEQPRDTQTIAVTVTYPDKDVGAAVVNRLMALFIDAVAARRREAILVQSLQTARQNLDQSRSDAERLGAFAAELERMAAQGLMPGEDQDVSVTVRRGTIYESIRKEQARLDEELVEYAADKKRIAEIEGLVRKGAVARSDLDGLRAKIAVHEIRVRSQEGLIKSLADELRTLPISVARTKKAELDAKARQYRQEVSQLEAALAQPGAPPAAVALQGIDAREFSVKLPARRGDQPVSSNRKPLTLAVFVALMGGALALVYACDRSRPIVEPARLPPVVRLTRGPDGRPGTVTVDRMTVRIDNWIKGSGGAGGPGPAPPVTVSPDGWIEGAPRPAPANDDPGRLAARIDHWLGGGGAVSDASKKRFR
jgi:hypothetical protein